MRTKNTIPMTSLIVLAALPALALGAAWQLADRSESSETTPTTTTEPPPPADELATNLLSPRRHPTPLALAAAAAAERQRTEELADDLTSLLTDGMCVTIRRGADVIFDVGGDVPLLPASNMKVLVAAVALDVLGPDFRFRTELRSLPPSGSVVPGDLYVIGGGDPVLATADFLDPSAHPAFNTTRLDSLVDQLVATGITRIDGDVVGDGSRYDDEFRVPSWADDEVTAFDIGPYDALLVNDGRLDNGDFGLVPAQSAANVVAGQLAARGIKVGGSSRHDVTPDDLDLTTLALVESEPLTEVLVELLHTSDNATAELIIKEIGFHLSGNGTRLAGAAAIAGRLTDWGVSTSSLVLDDGSGLSRQNRLTCEALSRTIAASPVATQLWDLLPVAGRDGTLADQFIGSPAEGELRAKTGTLTGVKALTGVLDGADDEPVEFALVLNGDGMNQRGVYEAYWLELVDLIGEYPVVVPTDIELFEPR